MLALLRCLTLVAVLLPVLASAGESPRQEPRERGEPAGRHEREPQEREEYGRYQANYAGLKALIAEATKLQTAFLEGGDLATFEKAGAAWEARASKFLRKNLAPLYASEFAKAKYFGPDVPVGKEPRARAAYQRMEAQKVALRAYTTELRKPD